MSAPVQFVSSDSELKLPASLTQVSFSSIAQNVSVTDKYIKGTVVTRWPMQRLNRSGARLKMVIKDEADSGNRSLINTFLMHDYATKCENLHKEDTIIISNFFVERSPTAFRDHGHRFQVIVDAKKSKAGLWVVKSGKTATATSTAASTATSTAASMTVPPRQQLKRAAPVATSAGTAVARRRVSSQATATACRATTVTPVRTATTSATTVFAVPAVARRVSSQATATARHATTVTPVRTATTSATTVFAVPAVVRRVSSQATATARRATTVTPVRTATTSATTVSAVPAVARRVSSQATATARHATTVTPVRTATTSATTVSAVPAARTSTVTATVTATSSTNAYSKVLGNRYTLLKTLKEGDKVDIYGVVKFFKPVYKTKGTDYCMAVTLVDPSLEPNDYGLKCVIFSRDATYLPKVYTVGDIVRFHRLKIQKFRGELQGSNTPGFAAVTFSGKVESPMEARTGSKNFKFSDEDNLIVQELRRWSVARSQIDVEKQNCSLGKVSPGQYFDVICQVVGVAAMETESCILFKIWDGTRCTSNVRRIDTTDCSVTWDEELKSRAADFMVDVCCYDNHMETAINIKPGQFIRLHNLHAAKYRNSPTLEGNQTIEFALHHGTSYGRGITLLPQTSFEVQQLRKFLETVTKVKLERKQQLEQNSDNSSSLNESSSKTDIEVIVISSSDESDVTPKTSPQRENRKAKGRHVTFREKSPSLFDSEESDDDSSPFQQTSQSRCMQESATVITKHHHIKPTRIKTVHEHDVPYKFRIRAKILSILPRDVKNFVHLWCPQCKHSLKIPRVKPDPPFRRTRQQMKRRCTQQMNKRERPTNPKRRKEDSDESTSTPSTQNWRNYRIEGCDIEKFFQPRPLVYVCTVDNIRYYKCPRCAVYQDVPLSQDPKDLKGILYSDKAKKIPIGVDGKSIMQYNFAFQLTMSDGSDKIKVLVTKEHAKALFLSISPCDVIRNEETKNLLQDYMFSLCPSSITAFPPSGDPNSDGDSRPWLECCIMSYYIIKQYKDVKQYQMFDTTLALNV